MACIASPIGGYRGSEEPSSELAVAPAVEPPVESVAASAPAAAEAAGQAVAPALEGSAEQAAASAPAAAPGPEATTDHAMEPALAACDANGCAQDVYVIAHRDLFGEDEPMTTRDFLLGTEDVAGDVDSDEVADRFWEATAECGSAGCRRFLWVSGDGCAAVYPLGVAVALETLQTEKNGLRSIRATTTNGAENSVETDLEFDGRAFVPVCRRSCGFGHGDPERGERCDEWTPVAQR